ncbi:MAG: SCO family protein [Rubrimonas sp.]|uniref:SCO family protein n=1 Tax=Rubrimonas sp. TaxID=2036015 RepID=UPI002FDE45A2
MNRRFLLVALGLALVAAAALRFLDGGVPGGDPVAARLAACRGESGGVVGAAIGGDFALTDHTGAPMTAAELIDRPTLIYFGYTFCPDFCPTDVANMAAAADLLAERGVAVRTAFVSVDPARDTVEVVRGFVENHHPEMIGLTGDPEAVAQAARAWRVYYAKADDDPEFYIMDHSTFTYLMAPGRGLIDFFRHGTDPEEIAARVQCVAEALR